MFQIIKEMIRFGELSFLLYACSPVIVGYSIVLSAADKDWVRVPVAAGTAFCLLFCARWSESVEIARRRARLAKTAKGAQNSKQPTAAEPPKDAGIPKREKRDRFRFRGCPENQRFRVMIDALLVAVLLAGPILYFITGKSMTIALCTGLAAYVHLVSQFLQYLGRKLEAGKLREQPDF